jgi:hypothetical protein
VGFVSGRTGDLRLGLLVPALGVAAMIVLQLCILQVLGRRRSYRTTQQPWFVSRRCP